MTALDLPMNQGDASRVTARIKILLTTIVETTEKVVDLIEQAKAGEAWRPLGYESWTSYVAAEFSEALAGLQRLERIPIVEKLSATGMSQRAIASVTSTSVGTVNSDLRSAGVQVLNTSSPDVANSVVGLDGKAYLRHGRPTAEGMSELAADVPAPTRRKPRRPLPDQYRDAVEDLERVVDRLARLTEDDRFESNAARVLHLVDRVARARERLHDDVAMPGLRTGGAA